MYLLRRAFVRFVFPDAWLLSKLAAEGASLLWALIVLLRTDATELLFFPRHRAADAMFRGFIRPENEDAWGWAMLVVSVALLARTVAALRWNWIDTSGDFLLSVFWLYITAVLCTSGFLYPVSGAAAPVIAALALFSFLREGDKSAHARVAE